MTGPGIAWLSPRSDRAALAALTAVAVAVLLGSRPPAVFAPSLVALLLVGGLLRAERIRAPRGLVLLFLLALGLSLPSLATSAHLAASLRAVAVFSLGLGALAVGSTLGADGRARRTLMTGLVLFAAVTALLGLADVFLQREDILTGRLLRQPLGWHTDMAGWFLLLWPLALLPSAASPMWESRSRVLARGLLLAGLLFTGSRLGYGVALAQALALALLARRRIVAGRALAASLLLIFPIAGVFLTTSGVGRARLLGATAVADFRESLTRRISDARQVAAVFREVPWTGAGLGALGETLESRQRDAWIVPRSARNLVLELAATVGVVGAGAWLLLLCAAGRAVVRAARRPVPHNSLPAAIAVSLGGLALFSLGDTGILHPALWLTAWLLVGLAGGPTVTVPRRAVLALTLVLIAFPLALSLPRDPEPALRLARAAGERNDRAAAEELFTEAVRRAPALPAPRAERAAFLSAVGRHAESLREDEVILRAAPAFSPAVPLRAARSLVTLGERARAEVVVRRAVDAHFPLTNQLLQNLGTLELNGKVSAYRDLLALALALTSDPQYADKLGRLKDAVAAVFAARRAR